jgi:hypothetical protein
MNSMHYVGLDIHKKSISSCVRQADGSIVQESTIAASHQALDRWMDQLPQPWLAGMGATLLDLVYPLRHSGRGKLRAWRRRYERRNPAFQDPRRGG